MAPTLDLPVQPRGRSIAYVAVLLLVVIELTIFGSLVVSYFYLRVGTPLWPPPGAGLPELLAPTLGQVLLTASAVPMLLGERTFRRRRPHLLRRALPAGLLLVLAYAALKIVEYAGLGYHWSSHAYGSINWTLTGYQLFHVLALAGFAAVVWGFALRDELKEQRATAVEALGLYWYFVVLSSWLAYGTTYLSPYLM